MRRWSFPLFISMILCAAARPAFAEPSSSITSYCGTNIPPDEAFGFVPLPEGDVFCPLVADPKAAFSFASYVRGTSSSPLGSDIGSVGVSERFGLARWGGPAPGEGFQVSLEGSVFAQFDLDRPSYDLINADYVVGLPLTFRRSWLSSRVRLYHQSSHLGDEYLLNSRIVRENFAFESLEGILSLDIGPLRAYGGGEYVFNAQPSQVETHLAHGGVELREKGDLFRLGRVAGVGLIAAGDVKLVEELEWSAAWSARAGFEVSRPGEMTHAARRWSLLAEYYDGPSPYGQFFRENLSYYGVGLHFSL